jgi:hypothetical protein
MLDRLRPLRHISGAVYFLHRHDRQRCIVGGAIDSVLPSGLPELSIAAAGDSLWLRCVYGTMTDSFGDRPAKAYRSNDTGESWTETGIAYAGSTGNEIDVATPELAWTWGVNGNGGYLERTTDGGTSWTSMLTTVLGGEGADTLGVRPLLRDVLFTVPKFSASEDSAAVVIETYPKAGGEQTYEHFLVGITNNEGDTWRWAYLPDLAPGKRSATSVPGR